MSTGAVAGAMVAGMLALAGCQTLDMDWAGGSAVKEPPPRAMDPAEARLAEAALRAERALSLLAKTRSARADLRVPETPTNVPPELLQKVTLDYVGPLEELARQLAAGAGYALVTAGRPPPAPVLVEIEAKGTPLIHVFQDAGMQAVARALLTVDAGRMTVRLDWFDAPPRTEGGGG